MRTEQHHPRLISSLGIIRHLKNAIIGTLGVNTGRWNASAWAALAVVIVAWIEFNPAADLVFRPIISALGLKMIVDGELALAPFTILITVRLTISLLVAIGIVRLLGYRLRAFPWSGPRSSAFLLMGFGTGVLVMVAAIAAIVASGQAVAGLSGQPAVAAMGHLAGWLVAELLGAAGEELLARVALLLVAERFIGRWGAILVSGALFSIGHWDNPGANWLWLLRLFFAGMLLAYAVYRTGSIWWSIGYHTGWNWADAPLFGSAGSGFARQGHLLTFDPVGSEWITGGIVGPEGSVFAFIAVIAAYIALRRSTSALSTIHVGGPHA